MTEPHSDATWLQLALSKPILIRSAMFALVVGTILFTINHYDCCILQQNMSFCCMSKGLATATIPFMVSMFSSVLAVKRR